MTTKGEVANTATATTALREKPARRRIDPQTAISTRQRRAVRAVATRVIAISARSGEAAVKGRSSVAGNPRLIRPKS